jgi:glycosyltransferase involved in cell wall biosynthesis
MKVAVVIPTYNRRRCIGAAIDSALAQAGPGLQVEVLVVDDGSTDDTRCWLSQTYAGRPVQVLANAGRKGPAGGRNTGLAAVQARGGFDAVALLDSDDRFLPGHLAEAAALMTAEPGVQVVFGRARYVQGGTEVPYMGLAFDRKLAASPVLRRTEAWTVFDPGGFFASLLRHGCWFNLSTVVLATAAAGERMQEELRVSEDYEFWVRLSRHRGFGCLHRPQIEYSLGDDNISFEADKAGRAVEGHSPQILRALEIIASYEGLEAADHAVLAEQRACVLFDWGWRARQAGRMAEAWQLHRRSLRLGRRAANLVALLKLLPQLAMRR